MDSKNFQTTFILNGGQQQTKSKRFSNLFKNYWNIISLRKTISRAVQYRDDPDGNIINFSKHSFTKSNSTYYIKIWIFIQQQDITRKKRLKLT